MQTEQLLLTDTEHTTSGLNEEKVFPSFSTDTSNIFILFILQYLFDRNKPDIDLILDL